MNVFNLKVLAIICMIIDHAGCIIFYNSPYYLLFRSIGRLCFPIMAFLLSEGFIYTRNVRKYFYRLGAFVLISEPIFDFAFYSDWTYWGYQNIFFTLFLGLLTLKVWKDIFPRSAIIAAAIVSLIVIFAEFLHTDYGSSGVLFIFICYIAKERYPQKKVVLNTIIFIGTVLLSLSCFVSASTFPQLFYLVATLPLAFYNGELGKKLTYFFYSIYPLHLLLFTFIVRMVI